MRTLFMLLVLFVASAESAIAPTSIVRHVTGKSVWFSISDSRIPDGYMPMLDYLVTEAQTKPHTGDTHITCVVVFSLQELGVETFDHTGRKQIGLKIPLGSSGGYRIDWLPRAKLRAQLLAEPFCQIPDTLP